MSRAPFQILVLPFRVKHNGGYEYVIFNRADDRYWQGLAGGGEDGESPVEAAKREAYEEANIPLSAKYFMLKTTASIPVYHFAASHTWPKNQYVIPEYCFAVEYAGFEISLSHEHSEYKWVDYEIGQVLLHWENNKTALWELNQRLVNRDMIPA